MIDKSVHPASVESVEAVLRDELARGDAMAETVLPILRHLVSAEDSSVFSDEILARVRGMLGDLADGLVDALAMEGAFEADGRNGRTQRLTRAFMDNPALLAHLHAVAIEWQLIERLQVRAALDPVVSPLLQGLIAVPDASTQELAMKYLAAQARWCQAQRRMKLPLRELPGELLYSVLLVLRSLGDEAPEIAECVHRAEAAIRKGYDEGANRSGLATRLILGLGGAAQAALSLTHAGVSLFLTALAMGSGQERDAVILSTHEAQVARLALALRLAGLKPSGVEEQFLVLHPDVTLPEGFDLVGPDIAAAILASGHVAARYGMR